MHFEKCRNSYRIVFYKTLNISHIFQWILLIFWTYLTNGLVLLQLKFQINISKIEDFMTKTVKIISFPSCLELRSWHLGFVNSRDFLNFWTLCRTDSTLLMIGHSNIIPSGDVVKNLSQNSTWKAFKRSIEKREVFFYTPFIIKILKFWYL